LICYRICKPIADMDENSSHASVDDADNVMDVTLATEIKAELLDDTDFEVADVNSYLSDVETEDDDDVVIVDAEKTMQYLSGIIKTLLFSVMRWQYLTKL